MSAASNLGEQLRLFDPRATRAATGGDRPAQEDFEGWLQHPNVRFHGTFRPDWEENLTAHYGTRGQATMRLHSAAKGIKSSSSWRDAYYSGGDSSEEYDYDVDDEESVHTGMVFARKLPNTAPRHEVPVSDNTANRADYLNYARHGREPWEIPTSVRESAAPLPAEWKEPDEAVAEMEKSWPKATALADALSRGHRIDYVNDVEGNSVFESARFSGVSTATSSVARPRDTTTWEAGRIADPHSSRASQEFARQRMEAGVASTVPFESNEYAKNGSALKLGGGYRMEGAQRQRNLSRVQFRTSS